jgi:hypothetical protein
MKRHANSAKEKIHSICAQQQRGLNEDMIAEPSCVVREASGFSFELCDSFKAAEQNGYESACKGGKQH